MSSSQGQGQGTEPSTDSGPTSDELLAAQLAEPSEGFSAVPYLDTLATNPVWTIGYGSTRVNGTGPAVGPDTPPVDKQTAQKWLANEMAQAAQALQSLGLANLTTKQKAALEDFIYNLGLGAFEHSTLLVKIKNHDWAGAEAEFPKWDHAGGRELPGLLIRRLAEQRMFTAGSEGV